MGTIIVVIVLLAVVGAIIGSMVKKKKAGKSVICNCGSCSMSGSCPHCTNRSDKPAAQS